ncbi:MAG: hypothetical protein WBB07_14320 [Mycobacterium sp.]
MSSKRWGWLRHLAVLGGFEMVFAGVAAVGIFLTLAGLGVVSGAVALGAAALTLLVVGALVLRFTSHRGGATDAQRAASRRRIYRAQYRALMR